MPENNTAENANDNKALEGEGSASDQNNDANPGNEDNPGDKGGSGDGDKAKAPENDPKDNKEKDEEIKVAHRDPRDFIIMRQQKKIQKMSEYKADEEEADDEDSDDDEEVDPEDEKVIKKVLRKNVNPAVEALIKQNIEAQNEKDIHDFLSEEGNDIFKPYTDKVKKLMNHPSRRSVPINELFYAVAGKELLKIGADIEKKAQEKAKSSQTGGGGSARNNNSKSEKNYKEMTNDEFLKERQSFEMGNHN